MAYDPLPFQVVRFIENEHKWVAHQCAKLWNNSYCAKYSTTAQAKKSRLYVVCNHASCKYEGMEHDLRALHPIADDPTIHDDCDFELIELPERLMGLITKPTFIHPEICVTCPVASIEPPFGGDENEFDFRNYEIYLDQLEEAQQKLWRGRRTDLRDGWLERSAKDYAAIGS